MQWVKISKRLPKVSELLLVDDTYHVLVGDIGGFVGVETGTSIAELHDALRAAAYPGDPGGNYCWCSIEAPLQLEDD